MEKVKRVECKQGATVTVHMLEQRLRGLTDLQQEHYKQEVLGRRIDFGGQVLNVLADGDVVFKVGGSQAEIRLANISREALLDLEKDQSLEGSGKLEFLSTSNIDLLPPRLEIRIQVTELRD